ncbi:MAG: glutamine--tRNA ligase/YqeY domain fusion protein [Candidatus Xenobia bacterium]
MNQPETDVQNVAPEGAGLDFIRTIVTEDLRSGKHQTVVTRFPPEPNGYLHIGHAKAICIDFGIAQEFGGRCHLRFDDTNPTKEDTEYVDSIMEDVRWLGFDWGSNLFYASDYYEKFYEYAEQLIREGKAYVDDLTAEQIREHRGTLTEAGKNSPYRDRSPEENLDRFRRMRAGEFPDGHCVLRSKIDMASPNVNMRDPTMYRIRRAHHHRTGDNWCIYPMYDYSHPISDAIEGITHSLCTLEFENHRPLYDWAIDSCRTPAHPQQIEFARLNLTCTVTSKRKLLQLVTEQHVAGWDDPRMPTLAGLRRRGVPPEAIRSFCERIGVSKAETWIDMSILEDAIRDDLNPRTPRVMAVTRPLKVIIDNYPDDKVEELEAPYFPDDPPKMGYRKVPFSKELYIKQDDFMEDPPKKFFRLSPGKEVRLRWGYVIKCERVVKNAAGDIEALHCTYDPETLTGTPDGRKVKGIVQWVSAKHALTAEVRLYDRLFAVDKPGTDKDVDWLTQINPKSLEMVQAKLEPGLAQAKPGQRFQFEREGYFSVDPDSQPGAPVFNRIVTLRDGWARIMEKDKPPG